MIALNKTNRACMWNADDTQVATYLSLHKTQLPPKIYDSLEGIASAQPAKLRLNRILALCIMRTLCSSSVSSPLGPMK